MIEPDGFLKNLNRYLKKAGDTDPRMHRKYIDEQIDSCFRGFPRDVNRAISDYFFPREKLLVRDDIRDCADKFCDLLEALGTDTERFDGSLTDSDWLFLKEVVNDAAEVIEEDLLMTVMSRLVDRGLV